MCVYAGWVFLLRSTWSQSCTGSRRYYHYHTRTTLGPRSPETRRRVISEPTGRTRSRSICVHPCRVQWRYYNDTYYVYYFMSLSISLCRYRQRAQYLTIIPIRVYTHYGQRILRRYCRECFFFPVAFFSLSLPFYKVIVFQFVIVAPAHARTRLTVWQCV